MSGSRYPPNPGQYASWQDWATALTGFMGGSADIKRQLQPSPAFLAHRIGGGNLGAERALVPGMMMYNPTDVHPEYSDGATWRQIANAEDLTAYVLKTGDTMTGGLILPGVPADDNGAVPKSFVGVEEFLETETYAFDDLVAYKGTVWHNTNPLGSTGTFTLTDWRPIASPTGVAINFQYKWTTDTAGPISAGYYGVNNSDPALATEVLVSSETSGGFDVSVYWESLNTGDSAIFTENTGGAEWNIYTVTGPPVVTAGTPNWFTLPVDVVGTLGNPENNRQGTASILPTPLSRVPANGSVGQRLTKLSSGNYDMAWVTSDRMRWVGNWVNGNSYDQYDVSLDSPYLMIANKTTTDRPAPVTSGDPYYFYSGTSPVGAIVAKSLTVGQTYTTGAAGYVTGYRIYTTAGNDYTAYYSADGGAVITLISFTAATTGWVELPTNGTLVPAGTVLEVAVVMTEPDPTPTTFSGDWDYSTPNNDTVPGAGDITQSTKTLDSLRVSKTDNNAGDRSAELANMTAGDIIEGAGVRWVVLAVTDNGTWIDFTVAPAQQGAPVGVQTFTFETVTPTPISGVLDTNYWLANPEIAGFYSVDGGARVNTQAQYSIDLQVQGVSASEDWDFLAVSGSGGSGGGSTTGPTVLSGEATIASGTQVVSFPTPFTQPPIVTATTKGIAGQSDTVVIATIGAITTTNFQVKLTQVDSAFSTPVKDVGGTFNWIATGA